MGFIYGTKYNCSRTSAQFGANLGTKLMIFPINVEKWQLHFRSRGNIKIKLSRVCVSRKFIIFWYVFSKPVIATLDRRHYSHYPQFMDPFDLQSRPKFAICCASFFLRLFQQIMIFKIKSRRGICDTKGVRGELGDQGDMELQEAPNHKNRCPSRLKCNISIKMLILHYVLEGQITKCVK